MEKQPKKQPKYLGLITGQFTYQGHNGPETITPQPGQAVPCYLVDPFEEKDHALLPTLGFSAPVTGTGAANLDPTAQVAANLIGHLQQALANDGRLSGSEYLQFGEDLLAHPAVQDVIGKSVGKWISLVRP